MKLEKYISVIRLFQINKDLKTINIYLFLYLLESPYAKYRKSSILINHAKRRIVNFLVVDGNNDQGVFFYIRPYYLYFSKR